MKIGNRDFDLENRCYVMGILNVTPDSFSDGGRWNSIDKALAHADEMVKDGADIIDVGGESTRPGYTMISCEEELDRVIPVIEALKKEFDVPVSIDTYKGPVARGALAAGADVINDIWGFKYDEDVAKLAAEYGVPCILMHNREEAVYDDFLNDVISDMKLSVDIARAAGVSDDRIILDPGVGFGKTLSHNLSIINHLDLLKDIGYPVLLGTSRKSVVGQTLDLPSDQRLEGTLATTVIGLMRGCSIVRVHDVKENKRIIKMSEAILAK